MVDDGSSDNTFAISKKLAKENVNLVAVTHSPNRGYGSALKDGFNNAKYNTIVFRRRWAI